MPGGGRCSRACARRFGREPGDIDVILPFDEVVAALGRLQERDVGLQTVPLDTIARDRRPHEGLRPPVPPDAHACARAGERIANAVRRGEAMPPISLYRIGEVYFVRDGHHRVSVARALGRTTSTPT